MRFLHKEEYIREFHTCSRLYYHKNIYRDAAIDKGESRQMEIKSFAQMLASLKNLQEQRTVAVVRAQDSHTLEAVLLARAEGLVTPVLLGDRQEIETILQALGQENVPLEIIDLQDPLACAREAVKLVQEGKADCIMKGKIETGTIMKILVDKESGLRTGQLISLVAFLEIPAYHKVLAISDVGILMYPTLEQKKALIENAVGVFHALGVPSPKVAVMAAVEEVNPKMRETVEAATLKQWNQQGLLPGCIIEGPISYDLAVSSAAAQTKGYNSPVAGDVDLMVVPDIAAGNLLSKALVYSGGAKTAGIVAGSKVPLVITSRSATAEDKYMSLALAALVGRQ